jgi:lipoyl(octanoyl) transferase
VTRYAVVHDLGTTSYEPVYGAMQEFTRSRSDATVDEIWLTEHEAVFTQGQAGKAEHVLLPGDIPVVQSDRGGQVTYHGPGQVTAYLLLDLRRLGLGVRDLVTGIETAMTQTLGYFGIDAEARADAPGVYVGQDKIGALGLRVKHGCCYHGLSLNVDMQLEPFTRINPCGLLDIGVTHMRRFIDVGVDEVSPVLLAHLADVYGLDLDRTTAGPSVVGGAVAKSVGPL